MRKIIFCALFALIPVLSYAQKKDTIFVIDLGEIYASEASRYIEFGTENSPRKETRIFKAKGQAACNALLRQSRDAKIIDVFTIPKFGNIIDEPAEYEKQ